MNRWAVAFPFVGVAAALFVLAPNSLGDVPRTLTSLGIVLFVALVSFAYIWLRSRSSRQRAAALGAVATVTTDPDGLELAAHIAGVDAPRLGTFAVVVTVDGIQFWSTTERMDVALAWSAIRSVDVDPGSIPGARSRPSILIYTHVSPRIAIRLIPQGKYGVGRLGVERVGQVVARLRELQPSPSA